MPSALLPFPSRLFIIFFSSLHQVLQVYWTDYQWPASRHCPYYQGKQMAIQPPRARGPQVHGSMLLCGTTNPFFNYYYAVNDSANAQNIEAEGIERQRE